MTEKISERTFGKVYKGRNTKDNVMTAIRVMDITKISPKIRGTFLSRELDMLIKVRHPSVLEIYNIFLT